VKFTGPLGSVGAFLESAREAHFKNLEVHFGPGASKMAGSMLKSPEVLEKENPYSCTDFLGTEIEPDFGTVLVL